jgi:hypothetical protein
MGNQGDVRRAGFALDFSNGEAFPEREFELMIGHESGGGREKLIGRTTSVSLLSPLSFWRRLPANP